jgi:O-antigen ligase
MENLVSEKTRTKIPYLLVLLVQAFFLAALVYLEEAVPLFDPYIAPGMSSWEFYITFAVTVLLFVTVVYQGKHYFNIGINWPFFGIIAFLFLVDVIGILAFQDLPNYTLTSVNKVRFIVSWFGASLGFYALFAIMPKTVRNSDQWNVYFLGALIVAVGSSLYSLIAEAHLYGEFLSSSISMTEYNDHPPVSFTNNRNTFGSLLLIGVFASFYLFLKTRRWPYLVIGLLLGVNIVLIMSKTPIFCFFVFLAFLIVYEIKMSFKEHRKKAVALIVLSACIVLAPYSLHFIAIWSHQSFLLKVDGSIYPLIAPWVPQDGAYPLFHSIPERVQFWQMVVDLISRSPVSLIFGVGHWNMGWALGAIKSDAVRVESAHSGFVDVLGRNGIVGLIIYVAMLAYFIWGVVDNFKHKRNGTMACLFIFIGTILHGLFEDTNFMNLQTKDCILFIMAYLPVLSNWYFDRHPEKEAEPSPLETTLEKPTSSLALPKVVQGGFAGYFVSLLSLILLGFGGFYAFYLKHNVFANVYFFIELAFMLLCVPLFVFLAKPLKPLKEFNRDKALTIVSFVWCLVCFIFSFLFANPIALSLILVSGVALVVALVLLHKKDFTKEFLLSYALYATFAGISILVSRLFIRYVVIPSPTYQPYLVICLFFVAFFALTALAFIPFTSKWLAPQFLDGYVAIEDRFVYYFHVYDHHNLEQIEKATFASSTKHA